MSTAPVGQFVWYELLTSDLDAAQDFYADVVGWQLQDSGMPDMRYLLAHTEAGPVGGLMTLPPEACLAGARPHWMVYVSVADVDAQAAEVVQAGGSIQMPAQDIPGVGRFALVRDPQGGFLTLFKSLSNEQSAPAPAGTPGHIGWHELHTTDVPSAMAFYAQQFGWTALEAMDMGPAGPYQLFATGAEAVGGIMTKMPEVPLPFWLIYLNVAQIDRAIERVQAGGGQLLNGPMQVPGNGWVAQCLDPQGAAFALFGSR